MMMRMFQVTLIVSLLGLAACYAYARDWKMFALGLLYGVASGVLFLC